MTLQSNNNGYRAVSIKNFPLIYGAYCSKMIHHIFQEAT